MTELLQFGISGLVLGAIYAIAASGLVVTYTTTGVFNFGHGAVGGLAAFGFWWLTVEHGLPLLVAAAVVVVASALVGVALERAVFRRFRQAAIESTLVVTIALTLVIIGVTNQLFDPTAPRRLAPLLGDRHIMVADVRVSGDSLLILAVAVAVAVGLRMVLFGTRLGVAMRAVVDNPELAAYAGVRARRVAQASWAIGFGVAGLSGVLFAAGRPIQIIVLAFLVLNAYAAAIVGRLRSLPLTVAGALGLGVLQELTNVSYLWPSGEVWSRARLAVPGLFLLAAVFFVPAAGLRIGRVVGRDEPRPPRPAGIAVRAVVGVGLVALIAQLLPADQLPTLSRGLVFAVVLLSLVVLTGYGGQITLATYLFMAIGCWTAGSLVEGGNVLALLVAAAIAAPVGAVVALPSLRLRGLYLALTTFAVALAGQYLVIGDTRLFGSGPLTIQRPQIGRWAADSDAAFAVAVAAVFAVASTAVLLVRRSRYGRLLAAIRDSEAASATLGLDVRLPKLVTFAASASLAAIGGALFGAQSLIVGDVNFEPINNLVIFMIAVVGGVTTVTGALIGGFLYAFMIEVQVEQPDIAGLTFALVGLAAVALGRHPNGVAGMVLARLRRARAEVA
ncbi:MAG: ABC transporter permease [Actinomycetota bacterium]|nr:ABC transporter permease [Actinomycetota bacterium]